MTDITKCKGIGCVVKEKCFRHTAVNGYWQSWFVKQPGNDENCPEFLPISDKILPKNADNPQKTTKYREET